MKSAIVVLRILRLERSCVDGSVYLGTEIALKGHKCGGKHRL